MRRELAIVAAGLGVLVCLGACTRAQVIDTQPPRESSPPSAAPVTASTAPTTAPPDPAPAPSTAPVAATHFYDKAKAQWTDGATAISAQQGMYWLAAANDLQSGQSTDGGDTSGYPKAIDELKNLASLPDAQQTPAQNAQYHADIDDLNSFFGTPGLYS